MQLLLADPIIEQIYPQIPSGLSLAVILVGNDPASEIYVHKKQQTLEALDGTLTIHRFEDDTDESEIKERIKELNIDRKVDGIIVQIPLPKHLNAESIINEISPRKDADGLTSHWLGKLMQARTTDSLPPIMPATPKGILTLLHYYRLPVEGQHIVIMNDSYLVGRPLSHMLGALGATVTICNKNTSDLEKFVKQADILITATGKKNLISTEDIENTPAIIDVGIHRNSEGVLSGDIYHTDLAYDGLITPVPGGIGPLTVACLIENLRLLKEGE